MAEVSQSVTKKRKRLDNSDSPLHALFTDSEPEQYHREAILFFLRKVETVAGTVVAKKLEYVGQSPLTDLTI